jgi:hypothetical protein
VDTVDISPLTAATLCVWGWSCVPAPIEPWIAFDLEKKPRRPMSRLDMLEAQAEAEWDARQHPFGTRW